MKGTASELDIYEYVDRLAASCSGVAEIWLIGSRANGTERPESDWDLLVFGDETSLDCLAQALELHREDVDCLVVGGVDEFSSAWGPRAKSGSLSGWKWKRISDAEAQYTEAKPAGNGDSFNVVRKQRNGKLLLSAGQHAI
jgi:predicted nucleotidyltransferase